jgi:hypothetical protein
MELVENETSDEKSHPDKITLEFGKLLELQSSPTRVPSSSLLSTMSWDGDGNLKVK